MVGIIKVIIFTLLLAFLPATTSAQIDKKDSTISFRIEKHDNNPAPIVFLVFANQREIEIIKDERITISPDSNMAAVLKYGKIGDTITRATVYKNDGSILNQFNVIALDKIAICNDGRVAVYGFLPTGHGGGKSYLRFYNKDGTESVKNQKKYGGFHCGIFLAYTDYFVFIAHEKTGIAKNMNIISQVFDAENNLYRERIITNVPDVFAFQIPEVDENKNIIIYHSGSYTGINQDIDRFTLYYDYKNDLIKTDNE